MNSHTSVASASSGASKWTSLNPADTKAKPIVRPRYALRCCFVFQIDTDVNTLCLALEWPRGCREHQARCRTRHRTGVRARTRPHTHRFRSRNHTGVVQWQRLCRFKTCSDTRLTFASRRSATADAEVLVTFVSGPSPPTRWPQSSPSTRHWFDTSSESSL
jgi:hypothetical protein